jgi:RHS repeat-associated protein
VEELAGPIGAAAVTRTYTYGLQRISQNLSPAVTGSGTWTPSFYNYDGGGSVRQLTNSAGVVTDEYEYDAFGNSFTRQGTTPNNYLYRGEQYDSDLGLYYLRARYYNPSTGRFLSRDPESGVNFVPKTLHKYLYVGGDPVNMVDPSGRDLVDYGIMLARSVKAAVVFNAIGCGVSVGFSLVDGTLMELFKNDPTSAAATAFGCLTMTASGVPGTVAGTAVTVTLNSVALAACGWGLYQAVNAENKYFADLDSGNDAAAEVDYQKALLSIFGAFAGCELTLAAMAF